ncbi:leukocyte receptor cluster member 1 homolog [Montipora capricornis]|uniref:leukocyte receptor cluster member 1 homolog n=1 Tax=Montipora foliosa TaxID=591990 RepID=UPI0035F19A28
MNILPKKSWHVRNKDNVERVRRDEENARKEEKERERRAALAEQEARTSLLRDRASKKLVKEGESHNTSMVLADDKPRHLNFFADIEEGLKYGINPDYEAEKRAEQEKREKAIGLLTYLGQSAKDTKSEKPWYVKSHQQRMDPSEGSESAREKDKKRSLDPLNEMRKYLAIKKSHNDDKRKTHNEGKHKTTENDSKRKQKTSIEEMRRERLRREQEEHERERKLLEDVRKEKHITVDTLNIDAPRRYNSQYNPEFARRPRDDSRYRPY